MANEIRCCALILTEDEMTTGLEGLLVKYPGEHLPEVEKVMLLAYEPGNVREARERSSNIYAAIRALKDADADESVIRNIISKQYEITSTYAQNYIDTVNKESKANNAHQAGII